MPRTLSSEFLQAANAGVVIPALFVKFFLDSGPVCFWSGIGFVEWGGNKFAGTGDMGEVSAIDETKKLSANNVTLTLSGVPTHLIAVTMEEKYRGRFCRIWMGLVGEDKVTLIDAPYQIFAGRIDTITITDGGESSTIAATVESCMIDMARSGERRYTDEDQKQLFPDDKGLEYVTAIQALEVQWGYGEGALSTIVGGSGGGIPREKKVMAY